MNIFYLSHTYYVRLRVVVGSATGLSRGSMENNLFYLLRGRGKVGIRFSFFRPPLCGTTLAFVVGLSCGSIGNNLLS